MNPNTKLLLLALTVVLVAACIYVVFNPHDVDSCLDRGGRFNYLSHECEGGRFALPAAPR